MVEVGVARRLPLVVIVGTCLCFALAGGYVRRLFDLLQVAQGYPPSAVMSMHPLAEVDSGCAYNGMPCKYVWGHRLLVPLVLRGLQQTSGAPYEAVFYAFYLLTLFCGYLVFYWYLRHWCDDRISLLGVAYLAAIFPLTQTNPDPSQMMLCLMLYSMGVLSVERHRFGVLMGIMFVGVFVREEIGGVLILYALYWLRRSRLSAYVWSCLSLFFAWGVAFWGMRWLRGIPMGYVGAWTVGNIARNQQSLVDAFLNPTPFHHARFLLYLLVPPFATALLPGAPGRVPLLFRRLAWFVPAYVAILFAFSLINETKQFMPALVVAVPFALTAVFGVTRGGMAADGSTDPVT